MEGDPVIPAPDADDDDDVAWALSTAAVQWQRGQRADAVVWLRRAVDASISAGRAERTRSLTRLAANVADRLVSEALAVPDSKAPPGPTAQHDSDVDELLARSSAPPRGGTSRSSPPRTAARSVSEIPVDFDAEDAEIVDDDLEDDLDDFEDDFDDDASPTLPPPERAEQSSIRHELSSREYEYEEDVHRAVSADDVDHLDDDDDTESIVEANELLSERPGPRRPSASPSAAPAQGRAGQRPSQQARPTQGSRPPESDSASHRATSNSRPAGDRATASSWPPNPAARPRSDRATASSWPPPNPAARPQSDRAASGSRPPASTGARPASDRAGSSSRAPASDRAAEGARPTQSSRPSQGSRPPESGGSSSERARSTSDRPIEPIVTAEELFRQRALAGAKKEESSPPRSSATPPPKPKQTPLPEPELPIVDGVSLDTVRGFEDLPEASQIALARAAVLTTLSTDEEVGSFAAALVTRGRVGIMPAIADISSSVAKPGEIVFTRGTLSDGVSLRVVALESQTVVASFSDEALNLAMADCPWVADELRLVADRFQSQAGAVLGPLGDRLDDVLRDLVLSRLEVRAFAAGEIVVEEGKPVPGLHIVGAGRIDISAGNGPVTEANPGELLFGAEVLGAGKAHATARAGKTGALILFAPRATAHELLLGVPPLIEILAD